MFNIKESTLKSYLLNGVDPKVSIIITNYKKEPYLERSIKSCLSQTYKNIEIIVIDDASNEKVCLKIIKSIKAKNIKLFYTTQNYGHYMCCNYGIDRSSGGLITFLGADDTINVNHIENLVKAIYKYNLAAALSLYGRYNVAGKPVGSSKRLCEASILFKKKLFLENIGYFHNVRVGADTEYRNRALKFFGAKKVGLLNSSSYRALYSKNSLTTNAATGRGSAQRTAYSKFFTKNNNLYFNYKKDFLKPKSFDLIKIKNFNLNTFKRLI